MSRFALSFMLAVSLVVLCAQADIVAAESQASTPFATAKAYVSEFYPLFLSHLQLQLGTTNRLVGPIRISPVYHIVVAINDDTLYASMFVNVTAQPMIVTIPRTQVIYSILTQDPYGDIFETGIAAGTPGTYALTGPGWTGTLPVGVTPVPVPFNFFSLIFRADKFSPKGVNETAAAKLFRATLKAQPLSDYITNPTAGNTTILPELAFSAPVKTFTDDLVTSRPIVFLKQLQAAVASSNTPPLSESQALLSTRFNLMFSNTALRPQLAAGAQAAHTSIVNGYQASTGPNNWINFQNIGAWGTNSLERSEIAEYIQYGNGRRTAAYYQTFKDVNGDPLDGSNPQGYVLTFPAGQQPATARFWSLTAYTPDSIELINNPANKYVVGSYTPGLVTNPNGSVSIYIAPQLPAGAPKANWLPVSTEPFNIMLRDYGSEGTVLAGTYLPPAIVPAGS